jgi:hypothetical protein
VARVEVAALAEAAVSTEVVVLGKAADPEEIVAMGEDRALHLSSPIPEPVKRNINFQNFKKNEKDNCYTHQ